MCFICESPTRNDEGVQITALRHMDSATIDCVAEHFGIIYKSDLNGFWFENKDGDKISMFFDSRFNNMALVLYGMELVAHMALTKERTHEQFV